MRRIHITNEAALERYKVYQSYHFPGHCILDIPVTFRDAVIVSGSLESRHDLTIHGLLTVHGFIIVQGKLFVGGGIKVRDGILCSNIIVEQKGIAIIGSD